MGSQTRPRLKCVPEGLSAHSNGLGLRPDQDPNGFLGDKNQTQMGKVRTQIRSGQDPNGFPGGRTKTQMGEGQDPNREV